MAAVLANASIWSQRACIQPARLVAASTAQSDYDEWRYLRGDLVGAWKLRKPVLVRLYREMDEYVASLRLAPVLGFGPSPAAALDGLRSSILEHWYWLEGEGARLAPHLQREHKIFEALLEPPPVG